MKTTTQRTFGAEIVDDSTVRFRLWAPTARSVELVVADRHHRLVPDAEGFVEAVVEARAGTRYHYRVDGEIDVPDPASRFQPEGVHGRSEVIDPAFDFRVPFEGRPWHETVIYELHLGTFTDEGTYASTLERLDHLVELGVTAIELMPVAAAPGARSWGYDGVHLYAPNACYGRPEDLKRLIDEAHARELMVLLDVVYNHFGPEGNYLHRYARSFFDEAIQTPWGPAIDVDGPHREIVRRFFIENALHWLEEYRFDGLRLDAVHALSDRSAPSFVEELAQTVRRSIPERRVHLVVENDDNRASLLSRDDQGRPERYDAQWNDDFHHAVHVLCTGETDGYYRDYREPLPALGRCLAEGFAYQGEPSSHREGAHRGEPSAGLPTTAFVTFLQNHDQVGNRALGERLSSLVEDDALEAAVTLALLAPSVPLLFMGEEWAASTPFLFFCDFSGDLREAVREGRRMEFASFSAFTGESARATIPDPSTPETMTRSVLRWQERELAPHRHVLERYTQLLAVRRREIVPRLEAIRRGHYAIDGDRLGVRYTAEAFTLGLDFNAGKQAVARPRLERERILATTGNVEAPHRLPGWGVVWWLSE